MTSGINFTKKIKMRNIIYVLILAAVISCKGKEKKEQTSGVNDTIQSDTTKTVYTCPMHPEVTSDKSGQCPQCGMDLQAKG